MTAGSFALSFTTAILLSIKNIRKMTTDMILMLTTLDSIVWTTNERQETISVEEYREV